MSARRFGHHEAAQYVIRRSDYSPADHIGRLPFRDPGEAEKFIDALSKAGLAQ